MPRLVNLGEGYGVVAWPDEASDEQIVNDYNALESERLRAIEEGKLVNARLADIMESNRPTLGKTLLRGALGLREGAAGITKQAVGNLARSLVVPEGGLQVSTRPTNPMAPARLLEEAGKGLAEEGTKQLEEAQYEGERLGGGLPGQIAGTVGTIAGASAPALLAAPLGLPAAAVAGGITAYGPTAEQFKERLMQLNPNLSEEEAYRKAEGPAGLVAVATGLLTRAFGGTERLIEHITRTGLKQQGVESLFKQVFKAASLEAPEEFTQQLAQGYTEKAYIDPNKPVGEIWNESGLAALAGFGLGGATAGGILISARLGGAAVQRIETALEPGRLRRQSRRASVERIKQAIAEREAQDAQAARTTIEAPSQQAQRLEQEAQERLRVRGAEENRVEAQPGAVTDPWDQLNRQYGKSDNPLASDSLVIQNEQGVVSIQGRSIDGNLVEVGKFTPEESAEWIAADALPRAERRAAQTAIRNRIAQRMLQPAQPGAVTPPPLPTPPTARFQIGERVGMDNGITGTVRPATKSGYGFAVGDPVVFGDGTDDQYPLHEMWKPLADIKREIATKPFNRLEAVAAVPSYPFIPPALVDRALATMERLHNRLIDRGIDPDTSAANREPEHQLMQQITGSLERLGRQNKSVQKKYKRANAKTAADALAQVNERLQAADALPAQPPAGTELLSPAQQRIPIEIQRADGTRVKGEFNGYYDLRSMGRGTVPSVGWLNAEGKMTHGLLGAGETIIGTVPTFEEWMASKQQQSPSDLRRLEDSTAFGMAGPEFGTVDWRAFTTEHPNGNIVDWAKLRAEVESGRLNGGEAGNALLLHFLRRSDLHPAEIAILDVTPADVAGISETGTGFYGRHISYEVLPSMIQIVARGFHGNTISQAEFVRTLNHELTHNNITAKWESASMDVRQDLADLFSFIVDRSKGTEFENHNLVKNAGELLAEAFSNPAVQRWMASLDYSMHVRRDERGRPLIPPPQFRKSVFRQFLEIVKRILRLPDFLTDMFGNRVETITALDQAINLGNQLEGTRRVAPNTPIVSYSPATPPAAPTTGPPPTPPPIEGMQVAGGQAEVGRIAEEIYAKREQGAAALEGLAFERRQYRVAKGELKRLAGIATGRFITDGITAEQLKGYPDPMENVGIEEGQINVGPEFATKLNAVQVDFNPANVHDMQGEIFYENAAHRLVKLRDRINSLVQAANYYEILKVDPEEQKDLAEQIAKLQNQEAILGQATWNGQSVAERAAEIEATNAQRQDRFAQRNALGLDPVIEFFGDNVGSYRNFSDKAQAGLAMAQAIQAGAPPDQVAAAAAQVQQWVTLPTDVQNAIRNGFPLNKEQKASIFAAIAKTFEDFDIQRNRMLEMQKTEEPKIAARIADLLRNITDAKIESGLSDILLADIRDTLEGEIGRTGTLESQERAQELKGRLSAIRSFAEWMGRNIETNRALFDALVSPVGQREYALSANQNYGTDSKTVAMIIAEAKRNPDFSSAVVNLIEASDKKLLQLPVAQLERIQELLAEGDPDGAKAVADNLQKMALSRASAANTAVRSAMRELDTLQIQQKTLLEGNAMFNEVAALPEYTQIRDIVNASPYGLTEPMVEQNNTATTFKPFGTKETANHPDLVLGAADDFVLKGKWFKKVNAWHRAAQDYVDEYDQRLTAHVSDPKVNPSPEVLGYDAAKVRGLRDAVERFVPGSFLEASLLSEEKRWKVPALIRHASKWSWFRQHDFVAKMVGGIAGTDLRGRLGDFVNHFLKARHVIQKYQDIPDLINKAMKSHPEVQLNLANYRVLFNELAHWGRQFGSPVRAGFVLPLSGTIVTKEDMELLRQENAFEEDLRRNVTETRPVEGVRLKVGNRTLVRPGAYVGDPGKGLPRHLNRKADSFIADILAAYGTNTAGFGVSANPQDPIIAFWNKRLPMLTQHVLDIRRQDRAMRINPQMQQAYQGLANEWMGTTGKAPTLTSFDELVNLLVAKYPHTPGVNTRDEVMRGLNAELRQYRDAASSINADRAEASQSRHGRVTIPFSAQNEFTRPAAQLELPSSLYDYGALTQGEHLAITSRANHERVVAYATAVQRAVNELQSRVIRADSKEITEEQAAQSYGGNFSELKDVLGILRSILDDFTQAYKLGNPALTQDEWYREGFGAMTSAVLALPTVGIRNMTGGQFETYLMSRAMGLAGQRLTMWRALNNMGRTVTRLALSLGHSVAKQSDALGGMLTGKNQDIFQKLVENIASMLFQPDFRASGQRVNQLGYDTRDRLLNRLSRIWQDTAETTTTEELGHPERTKARKLILAGPKTIRAIFDKIGVQQYDQAINSSLLTYADWLSKRLEEVAMNYGAAREAGGLTQFDVTDPKWQLQPHEWSAFKSSKSNEDSLALFRTFLEASANAEGFQLERNLWRYYQEAKAGNHPKIFTDNQFDAVSRRLLSEFNASTPANRASAAAGNRVIRNLLTLQGYTSDGLLKLVNSFGAVRDRGDLAQTMSKLPHLATLALMAVLIGAFSLSLTGQWEKTMRGRMPSMATPLDKDFYSSVGRFLSNISSLGMAQLFYVGDILLQLKGEVVGNRGFDPLGRVFPVSIVQRAWRTLVGMYNTAKSGQADVGQVLAPMADYGRSVIPYWAEAERLFGAQQSLTKQTERLYRTEGNYQELLPEARMASSGPNYQPTTIIRRDLSDAVSALFEAREAKDSVKAQAALLEGQRQMKKLEDFYTAKYVALGDDELTAREKASRDVWNDYQSLNPVVAGLLGKRPTQAQYELLQKGLTGERGALAKRGVEAWQNGAWELFGREGVVTREDVALGRGGGQAKVAPITSPYQIIGVAGPSRDRVRAIQIGNTGYLRPARPARPIRPLRVGGRAPSRSRSGARPSRPGGARPAGGPSVVRPKTRLGRLRRLNRRIKGRMGRRQTYTFE